MASVTDGIHRDGAGVARGRGDARAFLDGHVSHRGVVDELDRLHAEWVLCAAVQ